MLKVVSNWTGFLGGPGYTNHYFDGDFTSAGADDEVANKVRAFWALLQSIIPTVVTIQVSSSVQHINPVNGDLLDERTTTTLPSAVVGASTGSYAAIAGGCITWVTDGVVLGHRVRGRTFVVPLGGAQYDANGTLGTSPRSDLLAAGNLMCAAPTTAGLDFGVWHRPQGVAEGSWHKAIANRVADKTAYLSSRRD